MTSHFSQPFSIPPELRVPSSEDIFAHYARNLLKCHHGQKVDPTIPPRVSQAVVDAYEDKWSPVPIHTSSPHGRAQAVGILGAGVGGLYAAMMLQSLEIPYEILEASGRTGGRLFTYSFSEKENDYFDAGAMRFPVTSVMTRLFHLIYYLDATDTNSQDKLTNRIEPFIMSNPNNFLYFNYVRARRGDPGASTADFRYSETGVPRDLIAQGVSEVIWKSIGSFVTGLRNDMINGTDDGWAELMKYDSYSTREYMAHVTGYNMPTINWLESVAFSSGRYDCSLSDTVLEMIAFGKHLPYPVPVVQLQGGSQVLSDTMTSYLDEKAAGTLYLNTAATAIVAMDGGIGIQVATEPGPRIYQHVISTLTLPCLRTPSLEQAGLTVTQLNALRQCQCDASIKIAVKFRSQWWKTWSTIDGKPLNIVGGQSFTDDNIRMVVYPSYGLDPPTETTVLVVSYTTKYDALRLTALVRADADGDPRLKELVLRELAQVHNVSLVDLRNEYSEHFAWDWTQYPFTQGAFAFFGPGEYSTFYNELTFPAASGRLHLAGEALSIRHAWVVGALSSSWRAVREILLLSYPQLIPKFERLWGIEYDWVDIRETKGSREADLLLRHLYINAPEIFEGATTSKEAQRSARASAADGRTWSSGS